MNRYQHIVGAVNYKLFLAVAFLMPFPQSILRTFCVLWIVCWFMEGRWLRRPLSLSENKMAIPFLLFGVWYLWRLLTGLWVTDHAGWAEQMERYMSFGLMVPVGVWGVNEQYDWRQAGKALVAGCLAVAVVYPLLLTLLYYHPEYVQQWAIRGDWIFGIPNWTHHFAENISHIKHRLFLCSTELLGIVLAIQLWKDKKWMLAWMLPPMLTLMGLTGSRQTVLTCIGVAVAWLFCVLTERQRLRYGLVIIVLGVTVGIGLLTLHPRMEHTDIRDLRQMREVSYEHDVRFNIWGLALQHPEDYLWHGLGAGQSTRYMVERYEEQHYDFYAMKRYHSHNQYLEETMELGIPGMLLFILIWLSIPLCAQGRAQRTAVLFTTLFMLNMMTDCMFGLFCGVAIWDFGLVMLLLQSHSKGKEQATRDTKGH